MGRPERELTPDRSAADRFGYELRAWRKARGLSQAALGKLVHVSGDTIQKVEVAERRPVRDLVERCDRALNAAGSLQRQWDLVDNEARDADKLTVHTDNPLVGMEATAAGLTIPDSGDMILTWVTTLTGERLPVMINRRAFMAGVAAVPVAGWLGDGSGGTARAAALPSEQECAQWLAWEMWQREAPAVHASEIPAPIAQSLAARATAAGRAVGQFVLRNSDGSYSFAHRSFVDYFVAQRIFESIVDGKSTLFTTAQTTHETDLVIREFVLRDESSSRALTAWMQKATNPVLRVNSAGVLAKLGSPSQADDVVTTLRSDVDTRQLYLTAVASRVLEIPWGEATNLAAAVDSQGQGLDISPDQATRFAYQLAAEIGNTRDVGARWSSAVLLSQFRDAAPDIASAGLHKALRQETSRESLRAIGAALAGDNPVAM